MNNINDNLIITNFNYYVDAQQAAKFPWYMHDWHLCKRMLVF